MARRGRPRKHIPLTTIGDPTPERKAKAAGVETVPTECAGQTAKRITPAYEQLIARGLLNDQQATAAALYSFTAGQAEATGHPQSILANLDIPRTCSGRTDYTPTDRKIQVTRRFAMMRAALGDTAGLVDGVLIWDLQPARDYQIQLLKAALDRLATKFIDARARA